jgi:large subunit ribosomal protein L13
MKTKAVKESLIERKWHLVDARDAVLGRLSTGVAERLIGKDKPYFTPNMDCGDYVVVINASLVKLTRKKEEAKTYKHHTGHPGGFREIPFKTMMEKNPRLVIEKSVFGMLPKNKLRDKRLSRLKVFSGEKHTYKEKFN